MKKIFLIIIYIILFVYSFSNNVQASQVIFLDVGQGDAILIQSQGYNILIDGGPDNNLMPVISGYFPYWHPKVEYLVLTHPHADHLVGLVEFLQNELSQIRTGRVSPSVLDVVKVLAYGDTLGLNEVATINSIDVSTLQVVPWDKSPQPCMRLEDSTVGICSG